MEILREVHCRVMKGCGPDWVDKTVTIFLDDIDPAMSSIEINDIIRMEVKEQLRRGGFIRYTIGDIHNA